MQSYHFFVSLTLLQPASNFKYLDLKVIKLNAIDSTNSYLKQMVADTLVKDELVLTTTHQEKGRGQQGANWQSQAGKSLACSLFKRFEEFPIEAQFSLNMLVSLAIIDGLRQLEIPNIAIKWPNDIMSHGKKLAGILIENQIKGRYIDSSVIGIGLNVNETFFDGLPQATSLALVTGRIFTIDEVLQTIAENIFKKLQNIEPSSFEAVREAYHSSLFRKDKISVFETPDGVQQNGIIKGVSSQGKLIVCNEENVSTEYDLKEIKLLFLF